MGAKIKKLVKKNAEKISIYQILLSHSPRYGDGNFFRVLLKFKMTATDHTDNFFAGAKVKNFKVRNYSHFTITFPTIWRGTGDFLKVLLKFKRAAMNELHNFCGHKSQKLKSEITHILQPHYHPQVYFLNIFDRKNSYLIRAGDDIGLRASCKVQVYICIYNNMQITIHISSTLSQH